eukprot:scaffold47588_cov19-Tisochrysis_lutea.AAC.1
MRVHLAFTSTCFISYSSSSRSGRRAEGFGGALEAARIKDSILGRYTRSQAGQKCEGEVTWAKQANPCRLVVFACRLPDRWLHVCVRDTPSAASVCSIPVALQDGEGS